MQIKSYNLTVNNGLNRKIPQNSLNFSGVYSFDEFSKSEQKKPSLEQKEIMHTALGNEYVDRKIKEALNTAENSGDPEKYKEDLQKELSNYIPKEVLPVEHNIEYCSEIIAPVFKLQAYDLMGDNNLAKFMATVLKYDAKIRNLNPRSILSVSGKIVCNTVKCRNSLLTEVIHEDGFARRRVYLIRDGRIKRMTIEKRYDRNTGIVETIRDKNDYYNSLYKGVFDKD